MQKQSVSNLEVKKINRNKIYRFIRSHERVSKQEIASILGVSMPTVLQNVNELIERGLVAEVGAFESTGGRKAKVLAPLCEARYAIGIDITLNHIGLVLTDLSGDVLSHTRLPKAYANQDDYYQELGELAVKFLKDAKQPAENFLGFGISIPGIISLDNQTITASHALCITNVPCWNFTRYLPNPGIFTNDANAAMIAEMFHKPDQKTAVYLSLSNSVGGSIFVEKATGFEQFQVFDNLLLGDNCRSGEFGHMTLYPGGKTCYCGKKGCVDSYCSAQFLSRHTDGKLETFFSEMAKTPEYQKTWHEYLDHLAVVVNNLRMAFDYPIIIGGYVGSYIEPHLATLQELVAKLNPFKPDTAYIQPCRFKTEASALGAALRNIENFLQII